MNDVLLFAFLGLAAGSVYALLAQGIVVIFKGSGVLNFGHGAVALLAAVAVSDFREAGLTTGPAIILALIVSLVAGALIYLLVMRPLRSAPALARHVATLGLLLSIPPAILVTHTGLESRPVPPILPTDSVSVAGVSFGVDRLYLFGIAVVATVLLASAYRFTRLGLATRAVAESELAASLLGFSPAFIGIVNWMLGASLAGAAGILISPISGMNLDVLPFLVVPALAAALVSNFTSFWIAGLAAMGIGILEAEVQRFWVQPGAQVIVPFAVIILVMTLRSRSLPSRDYVLTGRPPVSLSGRFSIGWAAVAVVATLVAAETLSGAYVYALQTTCIFAIVLVSQVVVTGFVGQVSLAQMTFAGLGALMTARFGSDLGLPFPIPILLAAVLAAPLGALLGLPAVRVRGVNLAVVTLGLSVAVASFVFGNTDWTGVSGQSRVPAPELFGISMSSSIHPGRYALAAACALIVVIGVTTALRRGSAGRRLLAVRENERAAAAMGINVPATKLTAFAIASSIAAIGGGLFAYQSSPLVSYGLFTPAQSAMLLALAYIGGIATVSGAPIAAVTFVNGGIMTVVFTDVLSVVDRYFVLASGIFLILTIVSNPDGMAVFLRAQVLAARTKAMNLRKGPRRPEPDSMAGASS